MYSRKLAIGAIGIALAVLVVRDGAVGLFRESRPELALALAPNDPVALIASSGYADIAPSAPTPAQLTSLTRAASADPLYPEPFLARAVFDEAHGQPVTARSLGEAARARDPRWLQTHSMLLTSYARAHNLPAVMSTVETLAALSNQAAPVLGKALSTAAMDPQATRSIAVALAANPRWREAFIGEASGAGKSLAFDTLVRPPAGVSEVDKVKERSVFIERLMQAGDYQRAYLAWVDFLPSEEAGRVGAVYDGRFAGGKGVEPFSWTLTSNENASAERRSDSVLPGHTALDVNFFGGEATTIASEFLFVSPGLYRFNLIGSADGGGNFAGRLHWTLECLSGGGRIPLVTVDRFDGRAFRVQRPLTIPARGCSAQRIVLSGEPGEIATAIHAQFTDLSLTAR